MTTATIANASTVADDLAAKLETIRTEIDALVQRRENLMLTTQAELIAAGIPAYVIDSHAPRGNREVAGDVGFVVESYFDYSPRHPKVRMTFHRNPDSNRDRGPYWTTCGLMIDHGDSEVLLVDGDKMLVAETPDLGDTEAPHRKAIARLRTLARSHGMTVSVRDREVTLIDLMNNRPHIGDVFSAFKWLTGNLDQNEGN